jgi:PTH1 family peptidyl-tRNA hydrolase
MFRGWLSAPGAEQDLDHGVSIKLIVGLGNPGRKYAGTRHNVGFRTVEELTRRWGDTPKKKFHGELADARLSGTRVVLLSPHTFMNRSGTSVLAARDFYKTNDEDILVICDDFQLPLGTLRARSKGSSGGQKGLHDVLRRLGTQQVPRLRIGIGQPPEGWDVADYVLSKFEKDAIGIIDQEIMRAADAAETWVARGIEACMNEFN